MEKKNTTSQITSLKILDLPFDEEISDNAPASIKGGCAGTPYTVQPGDRLFDIAKSYYGDGNYYPKIQAASGIGNSTIIVPGQVLCVPTVQEPSYVEPTSMAPTYV